MASKLGRLWESLLSGLICLSPMGAIAYYCAGADIYEAPNRTSKAGERRGLVSETLIGSTVIRLARL
jgi:hypothetical protein